MARVPLGGGGTGAVTCPQENGVFFSGYHLQKHFESSRINGGSTLPSMPSPPAPSQPACLPVIQHTSLCWLRAPPSDPSHSRRPQNTPRKAQCSSAALGYRGPASETLPMWETHVGEESATGRGGGLRKVEGEGLEGLDPRRWLFLPPSHPDLSPRGSGSDLHHSAVGGAGPCSSRL